MLKNLLLVNVAYPPYHYGGSGINLKNATYYLKKLGYNVVVFSGGTKEEFIEDQDVIIYKNAAKKQENSPSSNQNYKRKDLESRFKFVVKKHNIKIVHFNSIQGLGANLVKLALNMNLKSIITMHDFWWICPLLFLKNDKQQTVPIFNHLKYCCQDISEKKLAIRKDYLFSILKDKRLKVTTVSSSAKKVLMYLKYPRVQNYTVIENGINTQNFEDKTIKDDSSKTIFGFFGGVDTHIKGFDLILGAAKYLKINSDKFEIKCYRVLNPSLKTIFNFRLLHRLNIKLFNTFDNSRIFDIFSEVDCLLVPSQSFETFSMSAREALFAKKIVISSGMGALSELNSPKHLTFSKDSSFELAEKMFYVTNNLKKIRNLNAGIKIASMSDQVTKLHSLYQN